MAISEPIRARLEIFPIDRPLVAVPIYNAYDDLVVCIACLCATLARDVPVLLIDDASSDPRVGALLSALIDPRLLVVRKGHNSGFVDSVNLAIAAAGRRDVVLVNSDVELPHGWLERLRAAAYCHSTVATATPLSNNGALLSVPERNRPQPTLPPGWALADADRAVEAAARRARPVIPTGVGFCLYIRRSAIDLVGLFDTAFSPGYGEEADFCQRAVGSGLCHVVADDLLVLHHGSRSFDERGAERRRQLQNAHEALLAQRYPWYHTWVAEAASAQGTPLAEALGCARRALVGTSCLIDATCLTTLASGTEVAALAFLRAMLDLPRRGAVAVLLASDRQRALIGDLLGQIDHVLVADSLGGDAPRFDLAVRPYQIYEAHELATLRRLGERVIVFHLDSLRYAVPGYAASAEEWLRYRQLTRLTFQIADGVGFNSADAEQDARLHGLQFEPDRTCVMHQGVDHQRADLAAERPEWADALGARPFLLMLGASYMHKNRPLAIEILHLLIKDHQWPGDLVLVGPSATAGGSDAREDALLASHPGLAQRVHRRGMVSEPGKRWLLANAALVLYPSVVEGFGFIPFEAAAHGTPTLPSRASALAEVLGGALPAIDPLTPEAGAAAAWALLSDRAAAEGQVAQIQERAAAYTWRAVAERTWRLYEQILPLPPRAGAVGALGEPAIVSQIDGYLAQIPPPLSYQGAVGQQIHRARWRARAIGHLLRAEPPRALLRTALRWLRWQRARPR